MVMRRAEIGYHDRMSMVDIPGPVWVMGAGSVGCYLGGCLAASGVDVSFIGRPRVLNPLREHGLTVSDFKHPKQQISAAALKLYEALPQLNPTTDGVSQPAPALVLLTVKGSGTVEAAQQLTAAGLPAGTLVVSFQNGVGNAELAQAQAPALRVMAGMVPYNLADLGQGVFHRGTSGALMVQDHPQFAPWQAVFDRAQLSLKRVPDLKPFQWGKLLINLNNPVNALSGLTLLEEFSNWHLRRCLAALMEEAIQVLQQSQVPYAQVLALPPEKFIRVLRLPNFIFKRVAKKMLQIDPLARSSMADDFALGRPTEIDSLCGEVVRLAQQQGHPAPRNAAMVRLVKDHTRQGAGPGQWPAKTLLKALLQAT